MEFVDVAEACTPVWKKAQKILFPGKETGPASLGKSYISMLRLYNTVP